MADHASAPVAKPDHPMHGPRRLTSRTREVLSLLAAGERPATAQDLHAELRASGAAPGLTTVYRALHVLADLDLVHEFTVEDATAYRACSSGVHDHLICRRCGFVRERRSSQIREWLSDLRRDGFVADGERIEVYGVCDRCGRPSPT